MTPRRVCLSFSSVGRNQLLLSSLFHFCSYGTDGSNQLCSAKLYPNLCLIWCSNYIYNHECGTHWCLTAYMDHFRISYGCILILQLHCIQTQADLDYFEPFAIMPVKFFKKKSSSLFSGRGIITPKVFRGNLDRAGYSVTFHNQLSQIIFKVDKPFPRIIFI